MTTILTTHPSRGQGYVAWRDLWARTLDNFEPFRSSSAMSGEKDGGGSTGRLPHDWERVFIARRESIDYVVRSYATPIAWHDQTLGWVIPDVKYSVTTTKHQGIVSSAVRTDRPMAREYRPESELEYQNHLLQRQLDIATAELAKYRRAND